MALGKQVGRLNIRVIPDATKFRDDLQKLIKRMELSMAMNLEVRADTAKASLAIAKFRDAENLKGIDLGVGVSTAAAKAQLAVLARARIVELVVKVREASVAKVKASLGQLTGARLLGTILEDVNNALGKIDLNLPKIAQVATGIASLSSAVLSSSAGIITLAGDLVKMGNAGLLLPAIFAGAATGIITLSLALKDAKEQLAVLGPSMTALQDSISASFWEQAKLPIIDFVQSVLPQLQAGFAKTATALGKQAAAIAGAFKTTLAGGVLERMFDKLAETMDVVTGGAQGFAEAITTLGTVGSNYLPRLAEFVVKIGEGFNAWLQDANTTGRLDAYIEDGITQMKFFASAVDGFIGVLRGLDSAATAAGGEGLKAFAANMQGAAAAVQSPAFQKALTIILEGASRAMDAIGKGVFDFGSALGVLAPQISTVLEIAGEAIGGLVSAISTALQQPEFKDGLVAFFKGIGDGIAALEPAMGPLFAFLGQLGTTVGVMASEFGPLLAIVKETFAPVLEAILEAITPLIPLLSGAFQDAIAGLSGPMERLGKAIGDNPAVLQNLALGLLAVVAAVKLVQFGALISQLAITTAGWVLNTGAIIANKVETIALMAMYAKDAVVGIAKIVAQVAIATGAWIVNTAAVLANKVETLLLMAMYAKDAIVGVAKLAAGIAISTGAWIANTVAQVAAKVASIAGAVALGIATVAQYAMNLAMTLNPIGIIVVAIAALVAGLIWFFTQTELGQDIWANFTQFLTEAWANIVAVATTVFAFLGQFFTDVWNGIVAFVKTAIDALLFVFFNFNPIGIIIANWDAIVKFFVDTWNGIVGFVTDAINNVLAVIDFVLAVIGTAWTTYWDGIFSTINDVWTNILDFIGDAIHNVQTVIAFVIASVVAGWEKAWSDLGDIVSDAWTNITGFVGNIVDGITGMIDTIGDTLSKVPGIVGKAFSDAGSWLLDAGKSIIQGLIDGITGMIGMAQDAAKGVMDAIANFFPHSPAKEGPFSGKGWTLYSGQAMGDGLVDGMESRVARVRASALAMIGAASVVGSVDLESATTAGVLAQESGGDRIVVQGDVGYDPKQIADEIDKKKRQSAMLAGLQIVTVK